MTALQPMAVYALKVDPGEEMVAAMPHFNAMVGRIFEVIGVTNTGSSE